MGEKFGKTVSPLKKAARTTAQFEERPLWLEYQAPKREKKKTKNSEKGKNMGQNEKSICGEIHRGNLTMTRRKG